MGCWFFFKKGLPQELILKHRLLFSGALLFFPISLFPPLFVIVVSSFVHSGAWRHKEGRLHRNGERWAEPLNIFLRT